MADGSRFLYTSIFERHGCSNCLRIVFNYIQGMLIGNLHNFLHIGGLAIQMNRYNGLGFGVMAFLTAIGSIQNV